MNQVNRKGWMDEEMMGIKLDRCFAMDSMRAHITDATLKKVKLLNCTPAVIDGDSTAFRYCRQPQL